MKDTADMGREQDSDAFLADEGERRYRQGVTVAGNEELSSAGEVAKAVYAGSASAADGLVVKVVISPRTQSRKKAIRDLNRMISEKNWG